MLNGFPDNFRMGDDEDVLNEFRQKQANFDLEEKRNEINNSRSLFVGALAGLAMAAVVGWFVLAPRYQNETEEQIPVIRRPQEQVKIPPVEPGNVEISSQEKTVYDIIERKPDNAEEANILPPAEQPNTDVIEALVEEVSVEENVSVVKESLVRAESLATAVKNEIVQTVPQTAEPVSVETKPVKAENKQAKTETKPVKDEKSVVANKPVKKAIAQGAWQIQLMSSPNKTAVEKSWKTMSTKYSVLSGLPHEVTNADLGAKGVYWRLKAGSFSSKEEATALCNKLKAAGGSCFVVKK